MEFDSGIWNDKGNRLVQERRHAKNGHFLPEWNSVIFTAAEGVKTVTFSGNIDVNSMTFEDNYTLLPGENASLGVRNTVLGDNVSVVWGDADHRISDFKAS